MCTEKVKNDVIVLTSVVGMKIHVMTSTICAYWKAEYRSNGADKVSQCTNILYTNGKTFPYAETPEQIDELIFGSSEDK